MADTPAACVYRFLSLKFCSLKTGVNLRMSDFFLGSDEYI